MRLPSRPLHARIETTKRIIKISRLIILPAERRLEFVSTSSKREARRFRRGGTRARPRYNEPAL